VSAANAHFRTHNGSKNVCTEPLQHCEKDGGAVPSIVITGMKPGVINKTHWRKDSPQNGILRRRHAQKMQTYVGRVMASVFWGSEGILLVEVVKTVITISSERYVEGLKKLKRQIRRSGLNSNLNQVVLIERTSLRRREATVTVVGLFSLMLPVVPV
jgi:hypothetical protein